MHQTCAELGKAALFCLLILIFHDFFADYIVALLSGGKNFAVGCATGHCRLLVLLFHVTCYSTIPETSLLKSLQDESYNRLQAATSNCSKFTEFRFRVLAMRCGKALAGGGYAVFFLVSAGAFFYAQVWCK